MTERSLPEQSKCPTLTERLGYTLATGRLFAPMPEFHMYCETLLLRPILTHEFADGDLWTELRGVFEDRVREAMGAGSTS